MPTTDELNRMLEAYQAGRAVDANNPEEELNFDDKPNFLQGRPDVVQWMPENGQTYTRNNVTLGPLGASLMQADYDTSNESNARERAAIGWGAKQRYDLQIGYNEGMNLEDRRAREQSNFWKVGNGAMKGIVTAGTTAVNTVAGTVFGLGTGLFELGNQVLSGQGIDLGKVIDAGVNNRLSEQMMKLQQLSEEWFPNYRTEQEQSEQYQREWWKHIGTANFIGDSFLKGFGFTVGTMIGGAAWSSMLSGLMNMKATNDLLRGAIAAANGDAEASNLLKEALSILKQTGGTAETVIPENILKNLADAAKQFRKNSAILQLSGATIAAMGEGTTEGIMAKNEYLEEILPALERDYADAYDDIEAQLKAEHPEWCSRGLGYDENGVLRTDMPVLTHPDGIAELERRQGEMAQKYQEMRMYVDEQGERLAGTTFLLNLPLLTATNTIEFGRMFAGGWKSARRAINTTGGVTIAEDTIKSTLERKAPSAAVQAVKESAKVGVSEMAEEMIQGVFSSGAKKVADDRVTAFNDDGFDPEATENFGSWFRSMYAGGSEYLLDPKNWQEGFVGLVTGLIGVPGIPGVAGAGWNGGVYGAVKNARAQERIERDAINKFNERVNDPNFITRWKAYIRHMKYGDSANEAAIANDQYAWHTEDEKQLINDIMLFDELGRLDDIETIVDRYANLSSASKEEIEDIRNTIAKGDGIDAKKISDEQIAERVSKQAKKMKDTIKEYRDIYDEFSARVPIGTSPEQVAEMVFTATNMKRFEHRFLDMFGEVMHAIEPVLRDTAKSDEASEKHINFDKMYNQFASFFTAAIPQSTNVLELMFKIRRKDLLESLRDTVSFDENLQEKVDDMIRLVNDREAFYNKLIKLENMSPAEFSDTAMTADKAADSKKQVKKAEQNPGEYSEDVEFEDMPSLESMKSFYRSMPNSLASNAIKRLQAKKDRSPVAQAFYDLYTASQDFARYASDILDDDDIKLNKSVTYGLVMALFDSASSKDDFLEFHTDRLSENNGADIDRELNKVSSLASRSAEEKARLKKALPKVFDILGEAYNEGGRDLTKEEKKTIVDALSGVTAGPGAMPKIKVRGKSRKKSNMPSSPMRKLGVKGKHAEPAPAASPAEDLKEKDEPVKFSKQSPSEVAALAADMSAQSPDEKEARSIGEKNHIRTAFGEISAKSMEEFRKKAKKGFEFLKKFKFAKMADALPASEKLINFLSDNKAFDNIVTVKKGDVISFVIDPSFIGDNENEPVIFMYKGNDVIGVLPGRNRPFSGISDLIDSIYAEYQKIPLEDRQRKFTFSKKSVVFGKGKAVFDLIYEDNADVPIITTKDGRREPMEGYNPEAPIIGIDKDGEPFLIRGKADDLRQYKAYYDAQYNTADKRRSMRGKFYYLGANGIYDKAGNPEYTPLRLNVEHLTPEVFSKGSSKRITAIHQWLNDLSKILIDDSALLGTMSGAELVEKIEEDIRPHIYELSKLVDIHDIFFNVRLDRNGAPELSVNWKNKSAEEYERAETEEEKKELRKNEKYYPINTIGAIEGSIDRMRKDLLNSKHSLQISLADANSAKKDFEELFEDGYITINANSLHPYNVDVFIAPWDEDSKSFELTPRQKEMVERQSQSQPEPQQSVPVPEETPTESPEASEISNGEVQFQIVGTRPSVRQTDTAEQQKARKEQRAKVESATSPLYQQLRKANSVNMNMSEKRLKDKLKSVGLSTPVIRFLTEGLKLHPELKSASPYDAFIQLTRLMSYDVQQEYNKNIKEKIDSELEDFLINFLAKYNVRVKKADLKKVFDKSDLDIAGAYDVIEKIIWLNENPDSRNKITLPEEFAHAFVELMGSSIEYGSDSADFKFLYNTVTTTALYQQVYDTYKDIYKDEDGNPDEYRIRKEAIGQALAAALVHNWDARKTGMNDENKSFWNTLKDWFERIVDLFKGTNFSFENTIDNIAKEILAGDTRRLQKVDDSKYSILDYEETLVNQDRIDGGKALRFMQWFSSIGNVITGSLAYRREGIVKRGKLDSLHDIDMIVPAEVHGINNVELLSKYDFRTRNNPDFINEVLSTPYFKKIKEKYPKMVFAGVYNSGRYITVNAVYSENTALSDRFSKLTGNYASRLEQFTEEERRQIYLFDFFLRTPEDRRVQRDEEHGINFVGFETPFREKLKMGRAKDIYDYQIWKTYDAYSKSGSDPRDLLFQVTNPDYQQKAVDRYVEEVSGIIAKDAGNNTSAKEAATAVICAVSQSMETGTRMKTGLVNWTNMDGTVLQHLTDFSDMFNMMLTSSEKSELATAMSSVYGTSASDIDMYRVMEDYNSWKITRVMPEGKQDDISALRKAFERLESVEDNRTILLSTFSYIQGLAGERQYKRSNGEKIGSVATFDDFRSLPKDVRNLLKTQGITEDEYNMSSPLMQDKMLRCAGV